MTFYTDLAPGDMLKIGDTVVVFEKKSGRKARLKILGDAEVRRLPQPPPEQEHADGRGT